MLIDFLSKRSLRPAVDVVKAIEGPARSPSTRIGEMPPPVLAGPYAILVAEGDGY